MALPNESADATFRSDLGTYLNAALRDGPRKADLAATIGPLQTSLVGLTREEASQVIVQWILSSKGVA